MHHRAQPRLALDDCIRHPHLPTQRRQENDQLDGIHIVRDQHQRRLLILNEPHHVVQPVFHRIGFLADILLLLALADGRGLLEQALLLLGLGLGPVLVEELEGLRGGVAVQVVGELGDGGGHLEAEVQDLLLALQADVFGPFHHAGEVAARLDVLADAVVAGAFFDEGVLSGDEGW